MRSLMLLPFLVACAETDPVVDSPTWEADVAPVVTEHCGSCHVSGGVSFPLNSYDAAAPMADAMLAAVQSGQMPPWDEAETDECQPRFGFKDDPRLSDDEIALLRDWAEAGAPQGDPATAAELPDPASLSLDDATQTVAPLAPYTTSGDGDEFVCFVMDPGLTQDAWLTGLQVEPGNPEVVHHVLVFDDPGARSLSKVNEDGSYPCFGSSGINDAQLLAAWAPGAFPMRAPEDAGMAVKAGSLIVMQIHYHPRGLDAAPDLTELALRWTTDQPRYTSVLALLGNASSGRDGLLAGPNDSSTRPEFVIPAGVSNHTETIEYTLDDDGTVYPIYSSGTHMHFIGTDMLIEVDHAVPQGDEPSTECLVQTPTWDFNWQRGYAYDTELENVPQLRGGDTLRLRCTYNNTLDNPGTVAALNDAGLSDPIEVRLGEETLDEMCLGVFGIVF